MQLRIFTAATTREAMAAVRRTLGDDAVIVASEETEGGVRLTAAAEQPEPDLATLLRADAGQADALAAVLRRHGTPAATLASILATAESGPATDPVSALIVTLARSCRFAAIGDRPRHPLLLVGPRGAGKTLCIAKLAARWAQAGLAPRVVTTDVERAGALAQLEGLLRPLGIASTAALSPAELRDALAAEGPVVVDSEGVNPFRGEELAALAKLAAAGAEPVLVMPAGLAAEDTGEIAERFQAIGVRRMIVTRLDAARRLGGILAAGTSLALAEGGIGPLVVQDLAPLSASGLARLLLLDRDAVPSARPPLPCGKPTP